MVLTCDIAGITLDPLEGGVLKPYVTIVQYSLKKKSNISSILYINIQVKVENLDFLEYTYWEKYRKPIYQ